MSNSIGGRESSEREHYEMTDEVKQFMLTDEGRSILCDDYGVIGWSHVIERFNQTFNGAFHEAPFLFRLVADSALPANVKRVMGHVVMPELPQSIQFTFVGVMPFDDFDSLPRYVLDGQTFYFGMIAGGFTAREMQGDNLEYVRFQLFSESVCKSPADSMPDFLIPSLARVRGCHHDLIEWDNRIMTDKEAIEMTDEIEFIATWKDTRGFKTVDMSSPSNPQFFHEYARCYTCNGEIEFLLGQQISDIKVKAFKCPHCKQPSSLLKRTWQALNGGE